MANQKTTESDIETQIADLFASAMQKYRNGQQKHGDFNPMQDKRNLLNEAEEEILDAINYLAMFAVQQRWHRAAIAQNAVKKD